MTDSFGEGIRNRTDNLQLQVETLDENTYKGAEIMGKMAVEAQEEVDIMSNVTDYGRISDINWPGNVSLDRMIKDRKARSESIEMAVNDINNFYVVVNPNARTRCIDGRFDPEFDDYNLGPQVPGGAPAAALAYRLGVDKESLITGTFLTDAQIMIDNYINLGLTPGGHRDERSEGLSSVGCGAIDAMDRTLATMTEPILVDDHKRCTELLLGPSFNRDNYLRVMGAAVVLNGRSDNYFRNREAVIDILEKRDKKSIAILEGHHNEGLVVVNMVPDTTLASNRFAETHDGLQAFGYDLWHSIRIADKLMPDKVSLLDRDLFIMAKVMTTVATLMSLTDGSQRLLVRNK